MRLDLKDKPKLQTPLLHTGEKDVRDLAQQLSEMHGVGIVLQTSDGSLAPVRVNTSTASPYLEVFRSGTWQRLGGT